MASPTYAITANSLTAETFRQAPASHVAGTGVVGSGDLAVAQHGTPNMSVDVAAGQVWVPGTLSSTSGFPTNVNAQTTYGLPSAFNQQSSYFQWYNATTNLAIAAADPTNPRIDLAVVSIQDAQYSGSNNQGILQIITGTPAASPSPPNAPASSVVLAQIAVAAGASSIVTGNITDKRPFMGLRAPGVPACRVWRNGAFTYSGGGSPTNIGFDTVSYDNRSGFSTGTGLYTCPDAGLYLVNVAATFTVNVDGAWVQTHIYGNGSHTSVGNVIESAGTASISYTSTATDLLQLGTGQTIGGYANSSGAPTGVTGSLNTFMSVVKVSI